MKVEAQQAPVKESVRAVETQYPPENLRNFSVIAHVDHGKSTLVDCMLEHTRAVQEREMQEQFLDNMELERERGITIKLQTSRLTYFHPDGSEFVLQVRPWFPSWLHFCSFAPALIFALNRPYS